ncbi:MAG TPA: GIY-YIG nuclease family protein, partial [Rhodocyclaceae bacterium]|nr:GIY-YIG nuclease family protein [Rhodocyclaceae bacterium]
QLWHLYLIECADGSLYTGITTDVARRYAQHEKGTGARYTRSHRPMRLLGSRPCGNHADALRAEAALRRLPKARKRTALWSIEIPPSPPLSARTP